MWFDVQSLDVPLPAQSGDSIRVSGRQIPFSAHGEQFSTRSAKEGEGGLGGGAWGTAWHRAAHHPPSAK